MAEQLWQVVALAVGIALVAVTALVGYVRGRGRKAPRLPRATARTQVPGTRATVRDEADIGTAAAGSAATMPAESDTVPVGSTDTAVAEPEVREPAAPTVERPETARGRLARLRSRLARSNTAIGRSLLALLSRERLDEQAWEDVEDTLISADLGVDAATELVESLRTRAKVDGAPDEATVRGWLREELLALVGPDLDRRVASTRAEGRPAVVLVVGVNGTGKTTTVGKLARVLVAEDRDVMLGAADTFRAAAADQLQTWGERVGVPTVRAHREGTDPAAVAFDAVKAAAQLEADVVLIDTAGRLHNKANLMDELGKVKRVIEKQSPIDEVLLVLDATTGQNGLQQAKVFSEVVPVTGIVLTKLDGTAKGGIVVAVQRQLGVPVKLVGLGEGPDDLAPFDPAAFVDALLE